MWEKEVTGNPLGIGSLDCILQSIIHQRASREPLPFASCHLQDQDSSPNGCIFLCPEERPAFPW